MSHEAPRSDSGATRALAAWASGLTVHELGAEVIQRIKMCILDGLGCGLYGGLQPWGQIAADTAHALSPGGSATLFAQPRTSGPSDAAMANGTAIHGFEIDDAHTASSLHPGAVVIPAALALAETRQISGQDFLASIAAGYEAGLRLGVCAGMTHSTSGFHVTGTVGAVAAAAASARAFGLSPVQTAHALGIGGTQASGLYCARFGAMTKRFHAGRAAQSGVLAGLLAENGFTGATDVLEAPSGGFLAAFGSDHAAATIVSGLGDHWEISKVGFKLHCSCASAHTTIDAVLALRARGLRADNLRQLTISLGRKGFHNIGWAYKPGDVVSAQMNGSYAAALALLDGQVSVAQFAEDRLADPRVLNLIERIRCEHDPEIDTLGAEGRHKAIVVGETDGGETLTETVAQRTGSHVRPLGEADIREKFLRLAAAASMTSRVAESIVELVGRLELLPDLSLLTAALRAPRLADCHQA